MKKIPTMFVREYENHKVVNTLNEFTDPKFKEVLKNGTMTLKVDGSCCAVINGELYKRYDAKKGKKAPEGAIPCCEPDPVTGHHPHWVKCDPNNPADKWFIEAEKNSFFDVKLMANNVKGPFTLEAVGPHFQGNPYGFGYDMLVPHGQEIIKDCPRTFEGIRNYLENNYIEGIVFWYNGEPVCKIKRVDFGFEWNGSTQHKH